MPLAGPYAVLSKPKADDGWMCLGIGACKRQLRFTLGVDVDLEERFALTHDLSHRPYQAHPCRHTSGTHATPTRWAMLPEQSSLIWLQA